MSGVGQDVFISYSRADGLALADRLQRSLDARGLRSWRDQRHLDPHQDFSSEIETAIERSRHVVVCLTPSIAARKDSFVRREIIYAQGCQVPITPVLAPGYPVGRVPVLINHLTWIPFWDAKAPEALAFDVGLAQLLERLASPVALASAPPQRDPFEQYLRELYRRIVAYLDATVFSLLRLAAEQRQDAVTGAGDNAERQQLPMSFFSAALPMRLPGGATADDGPRATPHRYDSVQNAFDDANRQLLLLGDPGAGKTTSLMAFARDSVARRLEDPGAPLPLVGRIAEWLVRGMPALAPWLAAANGLEAQIVADESSAGRTLMLLDGLDELPADRSGEGVSPRQAFVDRLGTDLGGNGAVVTSRIADFETLGRKLPLRGAVTLRPLTDAQLDRYLAGVPDLLRAVRSDPALGDMVRTPLLLSLLTFAYAGIGELTGELTPLTDSPGALRDRIFHQYVRRRFEHESLRVGASLAFPLEMVTRTLGEAAVASVDFEFGVNTHRGTGIEAFLAERLRDDAEGFMEQCIRLHLLIRDEAGDLRFIHLLLRDHFGFDLATTRRLGNVHESAQALAFLGGTTDSRAVDLMLEMQDDEGRLPLHVLFNIPLDDARVVLPMARCLSSNVKYHYDDSDTLSADAEWRLARLVANLGRVAVEKLLQAAAKTVGRERADYALALGCLRASAQEEPATFAGMLEMITKLLGDEDAEVRACAAEAAEAWLIPPCPPWLLQARSGLLDALRVLYGDDSPVRRPANARGPRNASVATAARRAVKAARSETDSKLRT